MKKENIDQKKKWDKRADSYPRFSEKSSGIEDKVINITESAGVFFTGKTVLDIGCGTGRFTIRIAKKAAHVTGMDISGEMLNILLEDSLAEGLTNISTVCADWKDIRPEKTDIVMATLTPALRTEEDFQRMIDTAEEHVIYLGWVERRESAMIREIYSMHSVNPSGFNFPDTFSELLEKGEYGFRFFPVHDQWERTGTIDEISERLTESIREYGKEPDLKAIRQKILENSSDGKTVTYLTDVDLKLAIVSKINDALK